jgi:hypothetical protein
MQRRGILEASFALNLQAVIPGRHDLGSTEIMASPEPITTALAVLARGWAMDSGLAANAAPRNDNR